MTNTQSTNPATLEEYVQQCRVKLDAALLLIDDNPANLEKYIQQCQTELEASLLALANKPATLEEYVSKCRVEFGEALSAMAFPPLPDGVSHVEAKDSIARMIAEIVADGAQFAEVVASTHSIDSEIDCEDDEAVAAALATARSNFWAIIGCPNPRNFSLNTFTLDKKND